MDVARKQFTIPNVDYRLYRLFHLSILWRASVSRLPFYSDVNLGPHEEKIRQMILDEDPGETYKYAFIPFIQFMNTDVVHLLMQPLMRKDGLFTYYIFYYGGVEWMYLVSNLPARPSSQFAKFPFFDQMGVITFYTKNIEKDDFVSRFIQSADTHDSKMALREKLGST